MNTISKILTGKFATIIFYAIGGVILAGGLILAARDFLPGVF